MGRFVVEVEGDDLGRAHAALSAAGIPTLAGGETSGPTQGARLRRRFFRSAAFPILLVIVIAFVAQRLIAPDENGDGLSYSEFLTQVEEAPETIANVTLDPDDTSLEVVQTNGAEYETGYPPETEEVLVNTLRRERIELVVERSGGGGSLLSWLLYLLPFLLFFAFWLLMMRRMREGGMPAGRAWQPGDLRAVVDAGSPEEAANAVRTALPTEGSYRIGEPRRWH